MVPGREDARWWSISGDFGGCEGCKCRMDWRRLESQQGDGNRRGRKWHGCEGRRDAEEKARGQFMSGCLALGKMFPGEARSKAAVMERDVELGNIDLKKRRDAHKWSGGAAGGGSGGGRGGGASESVAVISR